MGYAADLFIDMKATVLFRQLFKRQQKKKT